jgi:hypothetical protein
MQITYKCANNAHFNLGENEILQNSLWEKNHKIKMSFVPKFPWLIDSRFRYACI